MFDEQQQLAQSSTLQDLLIHYAQLAAEDREAWHQRVMEWEELSLRDLTKLHGELIAYGWIEQNTGVTVPQEEMMSICYRVTRDGLRTFRALQN